MSKTRVALPVSASKRALCSLIVALVIMPSGLARAADDDKSTVEKLVDTMEKLSGGRHASYRANHAKGIVLTGSFKPAPTATSISKAPHLQKATVPVTVRFSNATGVPNIPDADPNASPHGMAIRFKLPDGAYTDIVVISVNRFPVATPEEFLEFLNAIAASGPDTPQPTPIKKFLDTHPKALQFVQTPQAPPVSFATLPFYGVNAFQFTNAKGVTQYGTHGWHRAVDRSHTARAPGCLCRQRRAPQFTLSAESAQVRRKPDSGFDIGTRAS
jgi:hypothetical protein